MRMGNRKLKKLARIGSSVLSCEAITSKPTNRKQRRVLASLKKDETSRGKTNSTLVND